MLALFSPKYKKAPPSIRPLGKPLLYNERRSVVKIWALFQGGQGLAPSASPSKERGIKGVRLINNPSPYQGEGDIGDNKASF